MTTPQTKKQGPIRTEAIIPFLIVVVFFTAYFKLFFDSNLKSLFEIVGYHVVGAEVDVAKVETSFIKGSFRVQGIEITNPDKPTHNLVVIGDIRYDVLWDALLRAKIKIEEMAVEKIEINTKRNKPGKVKPLPPPSQAKEEPHGPSQVEKAQKAALSTVESEYDNNVLGDIAAMMGGSSSEVQVKDLEAKLASKKKIKQIEIELAEKSKKWNERLKSLPQSKDIETLGQRLSKVKTSNFKSAQELIDSLREIDSIVKEADGKYKLVTSTANDLNAEINKLNSDVKEIDQLVKKDTQDLQAHFRIPKLDAKSLSMAILAKYMAPYMNKINHYRGVAEKIVPPNIMEKVPGGKKGDEQPNIALQPRPRAKGVVYEFGKPNSYPLFWIQKISISSQAGMSPNSGNVKGLITDITTNQLLTQKPTVITFDGSFPAMQVANVTAKINIDNRKEESLITFDAGVGSYPIAAKELITGSDVSISFKQAVGSNRTQGNLKGLKQLIINFDNEISKIDYDIKAQNPDVGTILKAVFASMPSVNINAKITGNLPSTNLDLNSNIGEKLQQGFQAQINKKIEEAKIKINQAIEQAIGTERKKIESDLAKIKSQVDGEVKKISDQINKEKQKAEKQASTSKKESEKGTQKSLEEELKKRLGL